mgnify:CR=1 FL=1
MGKIKIGCQTYTWQMSGEKYLDRLPHIMGITAKAGFSGFEPETQFLGKLYESERMVDKLNEYDIHLAAVCLVEDWLNPHETAQERANANQVMEFLGHFPHTVLCTCQMPGQDRSNLEERQANLLSCINELSLRAVDKGILCAYHPNSPMSSIYRTAEDYEILLNGLDQSVTGWAPDVGHIAKGGMDPLEKMKEYITLIKHVHYKDMFDNGVWAQMGKGDIDFVGITSLLRDGGYSGWIIVEDECERAEVDPDTVTLEDGVYIHETLVSLID